jgi:hypothetical protein
MICATDLAVLPGVLGDKIGMHRFVHVLEGESMIIDASAVALFAMPRFGSWGVCAGRRFAETRLTEVITQTRVAVLDVLRQLDQRTQRA